MAIKIGYNEEKTIKEVKENIISMLKDIEKNIDKYITKANGTEQYEITLHIKGGERPYYEVSSTNDILYVNESEE